MNFPTSLRLAAHANPCISLEFLKVLSDTRGVARIVNLVTAVGDGKKLKIVFPGLNSSADAAFFLQTVPCLWNCLKSQKKVDRECYQTLSDMPRIPVKAYWLQDISLNFQVYESCPGGVSHTNMFIFLDIIKVLSDTDGVVKIVHLGTVLGDGGVGKLCIWNCIPVQMQLLFFRQRHVCENAWNSNRNSTGNGIRHYQTCDKNQKIRYILSRFQDSRSLSGWRPVQIGAFTLRI